MPAGVRGGLGVARGGKEAVVPDSLQTYVCGRVEGNTPPP